MHFSIFPLFFNYLKFNKLILHSFSILLGISLVSCSPGKKENEISEGVIEYSTNVVDENHPLAGLAPSSATMKFKGGRLMIEMSTMGMFNTTFISDPQKKTLSQMVKFMDIKNACIETEKDLQDEDKDYKMTFEPSKDTKIIAGYKCKKVVATMVNNPSISFDVYYTDEIDCDSINYLSPYRGIKGMLMDYRLKKLGIEMHFTATSVKKEEVPETTFDIPAFYKIVTREEMEKIFVDILK